MTQFPQRHSSSLQGRLIPPQGPSTRVFPATVGCPALPCAQEAACSAPSPALCALTL